MSAFRQGDKKAADDLVEIGSVAKIQFDQFPSKAEALKRPPNGRFSQNKTVRICLECGFRCRDEESPVAHSNPDALVGGLRTVPLRSLLFGLVQFSGSGGNTDE